MSNKTKIRFSDLITQDKEAAEIYLSDFSLEKQKDLLSQAASDFIFWHDETVITPSLIWALEKGGDVHWLSPHGEGLIHWLVEGAEDVELIEKILKVLMSFGVDVNHKNQKPEDPNLVGDKIYGRTPFLQCAEFGSLTEAKILVENGADLTLRDDNGMAFLDIFRARIEKSSKPTSEEFLKWFVSLPEGEKQMKEQMESLVHKNIFIQAHPDFVLGWLAKKEKQDLHQNLSSSPLQKSSLRL